MESPPKRVTRARAAAKSTTESRLNNATAASKAKMTRSASTTKRKTRADEHPQEGSADVVEDVVEPKKPARGRPRKVAAEAPTEESTRAMRGNAIAQSDPKVEESAGNILRARAKNPVVESDVVEPGKSTRGRPKKVEEPQAGATRFGEPAKRATRGRVATLTKATIPKKTVKFEEPDKENIIPVTTTGGRAKGAEAGGLKANPLRKPSVNARMPRGRSKAAVVETGEKPMPLSPKKATQVCMAKEPVSDDELATNEKTSMRPLMRSPIKPPASELSTAKKLDFSTSVNVHRATIPDEMGDSIMASPARRPPLSPTKDTKKDQPQDSAPSESLLRSPIRMPISTLKNTVPDSVLKTPLLQSPAKRPQISSTCKDNGSPTRGTANPFVTTPKANTFKISRFATPRTVSRPGQMGPPSTSRIDRAIGPTNLAPPSKTFSGRLSSILPRGADPVMSTASAVAETPASNELFEDVFMADAPIETMAVNDNGNINVHNEGIGTTGALSQTEGALEFREVDESPFFDTDESEDELASESPQYSPTTVNGIMVSDLGSSTVIPRSFQPIAKTPTTKTRQSLIDERSARREKLGFTPLAIQLSNWMAASPEKPDDGETFEERDSDNVARPEPSPVKSTFFEDEMTIRDELMQAVPESAPTELVAFVEDPNFTPVELDEEDLALAHEADEMSLLGPDEVELVTFDDRATDEAAGLHQELADEASNQPALSEGSQEYGDENALPTSSEHQKPAQNFATPQRVLTERVFYTTSKIPLKPPAEHTPTRTLSPKRSNSISRLPFSRPTAILSRNNTVIAYSPPMHDHKVSEFAEDVPMQDIITAAKTEALWSTMGTPARTPRRDLDPALLRGAIVFVDVHTTEGADASCLFTELLTQMGARSVKSWSWNGNGEDSSKIGITHVVFKDGGVRTIEKARETGGVVSCVGVGWVLDCERENKWLDETPYLVDTAIVPRGGHRRRKSMEPRAFANLNGTLIASTPSRTPRASLSPKDVVKPTSVLSAKSRRRESVEWVRSPASSSSASGLATENEDDGFTPLSPATPSPPLMDYDQNGQLGADTPGGQTPYFLHKENLMQKTAPVKKYNDQDGSPIGLLSERKYENVMMRLMAARRKSLQWVPKVGSPLARDL